MSQKQVALVTGGSRGIGKACVEVLGKAGYRVAFTYRSGEDEAKAIMSDVPDSQAFRCDLTDVQACQDLIKSVKDQFGAIDVLVNNAGVAIDQILAFAKPEDFDILIATNLKPVFLLSKYAAKVMLRQRRGRIINLSSVVGHTGNAGQSIYAATKAAITGFTQSIAQELAGAGILCNAVAPGFIATDMTSSLKDEVKQAILSKVPLKRLGTPEDVAYAVEFLASEKASYITGTTLHVNGGMYTT